MLAVAALLPVVVMVGVVVAITQGVWPSGLMPSIALVTLTGFLTLVFVDRLLNRSRN